jgi:ubiquinone/menaquinone biosynthesis C-methylase UbiE
MKDDRTDKYYNARAPEYEQIYYRDVPGRQRELSDEAERLKTLVAGKAVLEFACGTGYWTRIMSETANSVTAVDVAPAMLTEARKKELPENVSFVRADMFEFKSEDKYDIVALGFWFSHQPKQEYESLFETLDRHLTPGGKIWMVDNNPPAEGPINESVGVDEFGNNFKERFLGSGERYVILKNYFTVADLKRILSPRYEIQQVFCGEYYWSVVITAAQD